MYIIPLLWYPYVRMSFLWMYNNTFGLKMVRLSIHRFNHCSIRKFVCFKHIHFDL